MLCRRTEVNVYVEEGALLKSTGAGAFLAVTNGLGDVSILDGSSVGDGVHAVGTNAAPGTFIVNAYGHGNVAVAAFSGAGTAVKWDSKLPGAQGGGVTVTQSLNYVPAVAANWSPAPTNVGPALDQLALRSGPLGFGAFTSLTTAVQQAIPLGSGATTSSADLVLGSLMSRAGQISNLAIQHTGSAANIAGQTITYQVFKNGVAVAAAILAGVATTAGVKTGNVQFAPVAFAIGDVLTVQMLPSAILTAALTDVMASIS